MVVCSLLLYTWMWLLFVGGIGERVALQRVVENSAAVTKGATKQEVFELLGEPLYRWKASRGFLFGTNPPRWGYGTTIDLDLTLLPEFGLLNPVPVKLRIFSSDEQDLVISWSKQGRVTKVERPRVDVAKGLEKLYEPYEFVGRWMRVASHAAEAERRP